MSPEQTEVTLSTLRALKRQGGKFACVTAYDASFTRILEAAGVDVLLVGDSLGMVVQGHDTTLPVTLDDMVYHTRCVARARRRALIMSDMPFMSAAAPEQALANAARLMQEGGAHVVKIEGGRIMADAVRLLSGHGLPVCAHLGLLPQSVRKLGGYQVQGRDDRAAAMLLEDAKILEQAGADVLLLECVPAALAARITAATELPVIGIGAGAGCDGQVLVLYDMLGVTPGRRPRFSMDFLAGRGSVQAAVEEYVRAVKAGEFPGAEHAYT
ncbi:MAG: 3-methyl-2-oxobutanoate hydroxymethyltransferase [Gammaproteobacteria bacterium]|nr:3-methyl-2-oxobutanoate hydroxymethyltransferase [Gammaproteobacteria bacterium]